MIFTPSHWTPHELSNSWTFKKNKSGLFYN
jgi:hypothetical protein